VFSWGITTVCIEYDGSPYNIRFADIPQEDKSGTWMKKGIGADSLSPSFGGCSWSYSLAPDGFLGHR